MPVYSLSHYTWQVLRAAKRGNGKPVTGLKLRVAPTPKSKDGSFLTDLVGQGLLERRTGSVEAPLEATYALTELGKHAAEYGEYEREFVRPAPVPEAEASK